MTKIYKYKLPFVTNTIGESDYILRVLSVGLDPHGELCAWAEVTVDKTITRSPIVHLVMTGEGFDLTYYTYLGTVLLPDQSVVVHAYVTFAQ